MYDIARDPKATIPAWSLLDRLSVHRSERIRGVSYACVSATRIDCPKLRLPTFYLKKCGRLKAPVFEPGDESDASGLNRMKNVTATGKESGWWYYNVGVSEIKQGITSWLLAACQRDKKEA